MAVETKIDHIEDMKGVIFASFCISEKRIIRCSSFFLFPFYSWCCLACRLLLTRIILDSSDRATKTVSVFCDWSNKFYEMDGLALVFFGQVMRNQNTCSLYPSNLLQMFFDFQLSILKSVWRVLVWLKFATTFLTDEIRKDRKYRVRT